MNRVVATGCAFVIALGAAMQGSAQMTFTLEEVTDAAEDEAHAQVASERSIAETLGALRWGMSKDQLLAALKTRIRRDYEQRIRVERDVLRQDALYQEANERFRRLKRGQVAFDGRKTGWDVSPIADEFRHGSNESMMFLDDESARELYFFINGRLWKWYRELKSDAGDGSRYRELAAVMTGQFGRARAQTDRRTDSGDAFTGLTWQDEHTRVTLLQRGADPCVVYEDRDTLDRLALLRSQALPRGPKRNATIDQVFMSPEAREAWRGTQ